MKRLIIIAALTFPGALLATTPAPDPVESVAGALARGMEAEKTGNRKEMGRAAFALAIFGARPVSGEADIGARWRARGEIPKEARSWRGRALGPAYRTGVLAAGETLVTEQVFLAGRKAQVALVPQPSRSLAIRIAAPDEKSLCEREAAAPRAICNWTPLYTTRVRIHVVNRGQQPARYFLVSN